MELFEGVSLKGKTTMRIGGTAKYYAELTTREDVERAVEFAKEKNIPLIPLGGGSNMIFADGEIHALVVRIQNDDIDIQGNRVSVGAAKNLPALINELAKHELDLSPLTGILGTVGGAVFGNAGQGPSGIWIDSFIVSVDAYIDGVWKTFSKDACEFSYRESWFKHQSGTSKQPPLIWETTLMLPEKDTAEIEAEIQRLLQKRIETQPHVKTAGSCFKAVGETPAWQLIDNAGLRDTTHGGVRISEKHANFLINDGEGTFEDVVHIVNTIQQHLSAHPSLGAGEKIDVEMRFVKEDGTLEF